jgi:sulfur carrier protein ThiS
LEREVLRLIEGKGLGNKKVHRVNVSLTNKQGSKLNRLAVACNMRPTTLAGLLIEMGLDDAQLVAELQKEYCTQTAYRIVLVNNDNELNYVLKGREDI